MFLPLTVTALLYSNIKMDPSPSEVPAAGTLSPARLRCENRAAPLGVDTLRPRLSWIVESSERNQRQTAYHVLAASSAERLGKNRGDLWDSGKVSDGETLHIAYAGKRLRSGQRVHWKVKTWDAHGRESAWSAPAQWSMGMLSPADWKASWISYRDESPLHKDRGSLYLPPARHYRRVFEADRMVTRATLTTSALGIAEMHLNGRRIGDSLFEPGWSDYKKRAYYRVHDVTGMVKRGQNALGAIVTDGWYAGYVGYGLLVGYGPNRAGRYFYGKTPALLAQLDIEYADGGRETIVTDTNWQVTGDGPVREADLIMGESFDARRDRPDWCTPKGAADWTWSPAIRAEENGSAKAPFSDNQGTREIELGFQRPPVLQSYAAPPIRVTQEMRAVHLSEPSPGVYLFDMGQNFAGVARLKVKGPAGTQVRIRYGEMLHKDGRLMTENLRRARATDFYTLRGDPNGETWEPRFTYHGFQYVELTGLPAQPAPDAVTGLVIHNDTPLTGSFACSDEVMTRFWKNTQWTQRANFVEVPTDCPQRDERLGWMGDAQTYARTASYNADVSAFFTKWLDDVEEAQRDSGPYPDYCPYPMGHGEPGKTFGTAWTDAGIICPWTLWKVYGDTRVIERHWASMTRFMDWRRKTSPDFLGRSVGNSWGDWLSVGERTSIEYIDTCYFAYDAGLMADMAEAAGKTAEAGMYRALAASIKSAFSRAHLNPDSTPKEDTQTAYALALAMDLIPPANRPAVAARLADKIARNGFKMTTGFLGTVRLLPALSAGGQHDLAVRLFQSRQFPSWGYEVVNGANTVWERWDSYTAEHGFEGTGGNQNAAMNSFSHYSFGAVMEWGYKTLAGIDSLGAGFRRIIIKPGPPSPASSPDVQPINWVKASCDSPRGKIETAWKRIGDRFTLNLTVPANTTAVVHLPGRPTETDGLKAVQLRAGEAIIEVGSGTYQFESAL